MSRSKFPSFFVTATVTLTLCWNDPCANQHPKFMSKLATDNPGLQPGVTAYKEGDFHGALTKFSAIIENHDYPVSREKTLAALYLIKSLESLDQAMETAKRVSMIPPGLLPPTLRPCAIHRRIRTSLFKGNYGKGLQLAQQVLVKEMPHFQQPRLLFYQAETQQKLGLAGHALDTYSKSIFFSGIGNETQMRNSLEHLAIILHDSGRLGEAEALSRIHDELLDKE